MTGSSRNGDGVIVKVVIVILGWDLDESKEP